MGDRVEKTEHRRHTGGGAQQMQADTLCTQLAEAAGAEQDREQEYQAERIAGKDDQFAGQALQRQVLDHCRHHRQQQFTSNQQQCPACEIILCHTSPNRWEPACPRIGRTCRSLPRKRPSSQGGQLWL